MRFSLLSLLAFVLITGLWLFALTHPYKMLAAAASGIVIVVLIGAWILAKVSERRKPFWMGFAIAGWVYFMFTMTPYSFEHFRPYVPTNIPLNAYALNCALNNKGYLGDVPEFDREEQQETDVAPDGSTITRLNFCLANIAFIGHGYFTLLSGLLGGIFAAWMRRRELASQKSEPPAAQ